MFNPRLVLERGLSDTGQAGCPDWNMLPRIEQGMKLLADLPEADSNCGDFSHGRFAGFEASCFEVKNDKLGIVEWAIQMDMAGERPTVCFAIVGTELISTTGCMDEGAPRSGSR